MESDGVDLLQVISLDRLVCKVQLWKAITLMGKLQRGSSDF